MIFSQKTDIPQPKRVKIAEDEMAGIYTSSTSSHHHATEVLIPGGTD
jgi:hypothetical protein